MESSKLNLMDRQKGLAPILIVILIALAVGGYLVYQKQTRPASLPQPTTQPTLSPDASSAPTGNEETANWKSYTAMDNSYSFKYPDQWYLENPSAVGGLSFFQVGATPIHSTSGRFGNETLIIIDYSVANFDHLKNNVKNPDNSPVYTETIIAGKRVLKSTRLESADILITPLENGKDRILNLRVPDQSNLSILDQILSSFKFTDQNRAEEGEDYIMNRGRKVMIIRVKEGEYCEGFVGSQQTTYPKCEKGFKCQQALGAVADAPGVCVKE